LRLYQVGGLDTSSEVIQAALEAELKAKGNDAGRTYLDHSYEDEHLRVLALSGAATIARQMNRSEPAVRKRAVRLNVVLAKARLSLG
jgi:hypothetical protein